MTKLNLAEMLKNYEQTLTTLGFKVRKDWNEKLLYARRMKSNETKISYISKSKVEGLLENTGIVIDENATQEERLQHFTAERPIKFLNRLVDTTDTYNENLLRNISDRFNQHFIENIDFKFKMFRSGAIGKAYNENRALCGCMAGKPADWFEVYDKTEGLKLAALVDGGGSILIRALLWYCKKSDLYFLDNSYEQTNINGEPELRRFYQGELLKAVLKKIGRKRIDCAFNGHLTKEYKQLTRAEDERHGIRTYPSEQMQMRVAAEVSDIECFPYSDSFKSIEVFSGNWLTSENSGDTEYIYLNSQEGDNSNTPRYICCNCEESDYSDDYMYHSEYHGDLLCENCAVELPDREDYATEDDCIYDRYREVYILRDDCDY